MTMKFSRRIKLYQLLLFLYVFYILYTPPLFVQGSGMVNQYLISTIIVIMLIVTNPYRIHGDIRKILNMKESRAFILLVILSALYFAFIRVMMTGDLSLVYLRIIQNLFVIVNYFQTCIVVSMFSKKGYTFEQVLEFIFQVASFQGIICILMFLIPPFKRLAEFFYVDLVGAFSHGSYILQTRIYGISSDYTYGLAICHGMLSGICFYYALFVNKKYVKYYPLIYIVSILNGRTGLLVGICGIAASIIYGMLFMKRKKINMLTMIWVVIAGVIGVIAVSQNTDVYNFIILGLREVNNFFHERRFVGTSRVVLEDMLYFPKGINFVVGKGYRLYGGEALHGESISDVGVANDMFMGGLIYCFFIYGAWLVKIFGYKTRDYGMIFTQLMMAGTFVLADIKGQVTMNPCITTTIMLITGAFYLKGQTFESRNHRQGYSFNIDGYVQGKRRCVEESS